MKLSHLGFITIGIVIILFVICNNINEGFSMSSKNEEQKQFLKQEDKYYDFRLFPQVVKGGNDDVKFLKFNKENTKLVESSPSANIKLTNIPDEVEKCKIIDKTHECSNISDSQCGYCWDSDKILYGDAGGPKADVCTKKGWIPPGPRTAYFCQKKKDQALCNTMKDCGDATGARNICGWCPTKRKGMPKQRSADGKGWDPKYPDDVCNWKEKTSEETNWLGWSPDKGGYPRRDAPSGYGEPLYKAEGDCD